MDEYFRALSYEITSTAHSINGERDVDNIYIGGGTPSVATPYLEGLFNALRINFSIKSDAEISVECNPESVTEGFIRIARDAGVNRISLGVQTLSDPLLKRIGRAHDRAQAITALDKLTAAFPSVGADMMVGLPGQESGDVLSTVDGLLAFPIDHVSCYSLILEEGTPLFSQAQAGAFLPDDDLAVDFYDLAKDRLAEAGYERYEISNFCRNGAICRYNTSVWQYGDYLGLGLGASSFLKKGGFPFCRMKRTSDFSRYFAIDKAGSVTKSELINAEEAEKEFVMLGLRLEEGLSLPRFSELFGRSFDQAFPGKFDKLSAYLERNDTHIRIKSEYFYVSNSVISEIIF